MGDQRIHKYRPALLAKEAEVGQGLRNRNEITIEKAPDEIDQVQLAGERELAISNLHRETQLLAAIRVALTRMADGSYGTCLRCDAAITPQRLQAVPWAAYCISCQQADERQTDEVLPAAPASKKNRYAW